LLVVAKETFILFIEASCVLAGVGALSFERPASDS
jgi:hypothetical protein